MLIFPKEVIHVELDSSSEPDIPNKVFTREDFKLPKWQGEYNNISQQNTCSLDNILAILTLFKKNITESCNIIRFTLSETKFYPIISLINEFDFDKVRDHIAKAIGLKIRCIDMINQYNFFGSEGSVIQYLQKLDLCNDKYRTSFYCHLCENTFTFTCMVGVIGCVITNIEHSINAKLLPRKCKHCNTTDTSKFERLSSRFLSIPPLLTIEIGHLPKPSKRLLLPNINKQFTISHEDKLLRYDLAGLSILQGSHFYSLIKLDQEFYIFDGMRTPPLDFYPNESFIGTANTIFYTLHSTE